MRVRVKLLLPEPGTTTALVASLGLHLLLVTFALVGSSRRGIGAPPPPSLRVTLRAGSAASRPAPPKLHSSTPAQKKKAAAPRPKPPKKAAAERKTPRRRRADAPKNVSQSDAQATVQPKQLRTAQEEPEPTAENPAPVPEAGQAAAADSGLSDEPIPGGVAGLETDEPFTADWYVGLVTARLSEAWRERPILPPGAPARRVVIAFTISADGRVLEPRVHVPSGYGALDYSALRAVASLERLPRLPRSYEQPSLSARFVFELVPGER